MTDTKKIFTDRYNEVKNAFKQAVTKGKYVFGRDFPDAYAYYMLELKDGYEFLVDDSSVNGYYELADFPKMKDVIAIDFWDGAMYETRWTREKITETDKNGNSTVLGGLFTFKKKPKTTLCEKCQWFFSCTKKNEKRKTFCDDYQPYDPEYIHYSLNGEESPYEQINSVFNARLQQQIEGVLPKGFIYELGMPSKALLFAGVEELPIELAASTISLKSDKSYIHNHPFDLSSIKNLPLAIQMPIAVFDSIEHNGRKVILTELLDNYGKNFLVIINVRKLSRNGRYSNSINSIISLYAKENVVSIAKWFDSKNPSGLNLGTDLCKWADIKKASCWLSNHVSNVHAVGLSTKRIANVIKSFAEYQFFDSKNDALTEKMNGLADKFKEMSANLHLTSYKIIKRYSMFHGKAFTVERKQQARRLLKSLQLAISDLKIRKTDPYAREINDIQDSLIAILKHRADKNTILDIKNIEHYRALPM
ncbi:MAG: hypothetical protein J6Y72_01450 [Bacteroidales bacterium]|nr:hypothetical protein [Bacteroidales bacterium]